MHPIAYRYMGALKNFESPNYTPTATFPEICHGLLFRSIIRMRVQNVKFVVLPVPEVMGGGVLKNFRQSLDTLTLLFPKIFNRLLLRWTL